MTEDEEEEKKIEGHDIGKDWSSLEPVKSGRSKLFSSKQTLSLNHGTDTES